MKDAFRIAGFAVVLICCCGCSTPGQKRAWRRAGQIGALILTAGAIQSQASYQQYEINQLQYQSYKINNPYVK
jgi:hypothetical protein